jgi:chaperonin GroES
MSGAAMAIELHGIHGMAAKTGCRVIKLRGNDMKLRPLHDRLVVERVEESDRTKSGILIPDSAQEKPQRGKVISAGPGKRLEDGTLITLDVRAGDHILFGKYDGNEITVDGHDYLILREDEVLAVLEDVKISKKAA